MTKSKPTIAKRLAKVKINNNNSRTRTRNTLQVTRDIVYNNRNEQFPSGNTMTATTKPNTLDNDEFLFNVAGTSNSVVNYSSSVNPGLENGVNGTLPGTFNWLPAPAAGYNKYIFRKLDFYWKPRVSAFSTDGQTGKVVLSFNTDVTDAPITTIAEAETVMPHADGMPYEDILLSIPARLLNRMCFIRSDIVVTGDYKTYDIGRINVTLVSPSNGSAIGELRCKYIVDLYEPILSVLNTNPSLNLRALNAYSLTTNIASFVSTSPFNIISNIFGSTPANLRPTSQNNPFAANYTSSGLNLPPGNFILVWNVSGSDTTANTTSLQAQLAINGVSAGIQETLSAASTGNVFGWTNLNVNSTWFTSQAAAWTLDFITTITSSGGTVSGNFNIVVYAI